MKKLLSILVLTAAISIPTQAHAIFIVDTGEGSGVAGTSVYLNRFGTSVFVAGRFTTNENWNITSLEGWMFSEDDLIQGDIGNGGTFDAVLYGDSGTALDTDAELFRQSFVVAPDSDPDWYGVTGISQALSAGDFWLAFETSTVGSVVRMPAGVTTPMDRLGLSISGNPYNSITPTARNLNGPGFRVGVEDKSSGEETNAVPEPATMLLLGGGLLGSVWRKRKKA